jgi:hypothetical protein
MKGWQRPCHTRECGHIPFFYRDLRVLSRLLVALPQLVSILAVLDRKARHELCSLFLLVPLRALTV